MKRIPEPGLMEEFEQARAHAEADFAGPGELRVQPDACRRGSRAIRLVSSRHLRVAGRLPG